MVAVAVGQDNGSASGSLGAACNVKCEPCADMAEAAETPDPKTELERVALSYAQQFCERWFDCEAYWSRRFVGDKASCVSAELGLVLFDATLPGTLIDAASIMQCSARLDAATCAEPVTCFGGTGKDGDTCLVGWQCVSGSCSGAAWECGVCVPPAETGSSCSGDYDCGSAFYCSGGACAALAPAGQACSDLQPCVAYHSCVDGKCVVDDRQEGESCGPTVHQPYCDYRNQVLGCDAETHTCRAATVALPGEPCPTFGWCGAAGACFEGICRPGPGLDDTCSTDEDASPCRWPYVCANNKCRGQPEANTCGK